MIRDARRFPVVEGGVNLYITRYKPNKLARYSLNVHKH